MSTENEDYLADLEQRTQELAQTATALQERCVKLNKRVEKIMHARKKDRKFLEELKKCPSWHYLFLEWQGRYGTKREDRE